MGRVSIIRYYRSWLDGWKWVEIGVIFNVPDNTQHATLEEKLKVVSPKVKRDVCSLIHLQESQLLGDPFR